MSKVTQAQKARTRPRRGSQGWIARKDKRCPGWRSRSGKMIAALLSMDESGDDYWDDYAGCGSADWKIEIAYDDAAGELLLGD